jgi:hypothetical protein
MMTNTVHQLIDKGVDLTQTQSLEISILFSQDGFSFVVFDPSRNKYVAIESHEFTEIPSGTAEEKAQLAFNALTACATRHPYLGKPFAKTLFIIESRECTLVPDPVFDETALKQYLLFVNDIPASYSFRKDHIQSIAATNVWALPEIWESKAALVFHNPKVLHASTLFIESLLTKNKNIELRDRIFIHVRPQYLEIGYFTENRLQLYNTFIYRTKEDFIYFILFVFEQLGINPELIEAVMMGEIEKNSPLHEIALKYIRNVSFVPRFEDFEYSYVFDEIPSHYYFTLLNSRICAL